MFVVLNLDAKVSQRTEINSATIAVPDADLASLQSAAGDLKAVGRIHQLNIIGGSDAVEVRDVELVIEP